MTIADGSHAAVVPAPLAAWRTRDILVVAVLGVAFGVVFWAWGLAWGAFEPLNLVFPVLRDALYAVWLVPAVLAPLIVRRPGAALFAEMVAAGVSAILGSQWGVDTLLSGFVQGAAAELVFAFGLYR
jgi:energy-coupling factor transport system substrate-specific component